MIQILIGYGILTLFKIKADLIRKVALSLVLGIGVVSIIPFILQLAYIPLTKFNILVAINITAIAISLINIKRYKAESLKMKLPKIEVYEWPWLLVLGMLFYFAAYRCIFLPPLSRDSLAGPEAIAQFALTEHTFLNSVFQQDFTFNNNPFKSMYLSSLQLVYKLIGFEWGKMWLIALNFGLIVFLYQTLKNKVHTVVAGMLMTMFFFIPELYAYMYIALYDYSNMIFFFISLFYLKKYLDGQPDSYILFSAFTMAIATYIRPETLILSGLVYLYLLVRMVSAKANIKSVAISSFFVMLPALSYLIGSYIYLHYYVPVYYDVEGLVNDNIFNIAPFFKRIADMFVYFYISPTSVSVWSYYYTIAFVLLIAELVKFRKLNSSAKFWLWMYGIVFIGLALIGFLLPLADIPNTTKRAMFKLAPITLMYLANNQLLILLSQKIKKLTMEGTANKRTTKKKTNKQLRHA